MRDFLKRSGRWLSAGWFWPLVLLALPTCGLQTGGLGGNGLHSLDAGPEPRTSLIICDIPKVPPEGTLQCANAMETESGMSTRHGAVALANGETNPIALDFTATSQCGGFPRKVEYLGPFPNGFAVCLNCSTKPFAGYTDANAVCVAQCKDLILFGSGPEPAGGVDSFCQTYAHVGINFENTCVATSCSSGGTLKPDFFDQRRNPELLKWDDFVNNTSAVENTLSFTGPGQSDFSAGAASDQLINKGDAWVEFEAGETGVSHVLGLRTSCPDITVCHDTEGTLVDIGFAISLDSDGFVYVLEDGGNLKLGPFDPYTLGERFRIHVVDHNDGTADISYTRHPALCSPGFTCLETPIASHDGVGPAYPLRVDASFREPNASLKNVFIMRLK